MNSSKAIRLVYAQNLLIFIVLNAGRITLSLYALDIGASASDVGVVVALLYVAPLFISWPAGVLADRFGARWLFALGSSVCALCMLAPVFWATLPAFWIGALGVGAAIAFANVLGQNLVGVLSTSENRTRNFSNYMLLGAMGNFIGPLLTGFAIDHAGFPMTALMTSLLAALATVLVLIWGGLLPKGDRRAQKSSNILEAISAPAMRPVLLVASVVQVGFDSFHSFMPVYAHGVGLSASAIGIALSAFAVASFLSRLAMPRAIASWGEHRVMAGGFVFGALAFWLLPMFEAALALSVISFIFGLFIGFSQPITMILVFAASVPGRTGESLGLRLTVTNFMRVIGPAMFGATARAFGLAPLFIVSGALMCVGCYLSERMARR